MSPELSSVLLVVGLFMLGVLSPGPNFLVVVERSLATGFRAGLVTGLGVATGDAIYAAVGLAGLAPFVVTGGWLFGGVKILGGLYIAWIGWRMLWRSRRGASPLLASPSAAPGLGPSYRAGLLTDLSNPKTVVFFASISATAYDPSLPRWGVAAMWAGIVASSLAWRAGLAAAFSRGPLRAAYYRFRATVEAVFGSVLILFGVRLAVSGRPR